MGQFNWPDSTAGTSAGASSAEATGAVTAPSATAPTAMTDLESSGEALPKALGEPYLNWKIRKSKSVSLIKLGEDSRVESECALRLREQCLTLLRSQHETV